MSEKNRQRKGKIKITFFTSNLEVGGAERSIVKLANALGKNYFEVSFLLCSAKGFLLQSLSKEITVVDLKSPNIGLCLIKVIKYFREEKPDIIFSALDQINIVSIFASFFCKRKPKIIITERSTFSRVSTHASSKIINKIIRRFILPRLVKIFYKKADLIICVSRGVANDISEIIGNLPNIEVVYNPVVDSNFLELSKEPVTDFNINSKLLPIILAVGRLTKAKDYPTLLRAFSIVLRERPAYLVILGEGEERKNIENLIKKLNILENVFLLGFQKNPLKYMAKADIFVLSSILEGFPNVLVEAMACGVPVVSTVCQSGPNEIVENEKNGLLVPVEDEGALAGAIIKLLTNPGLRKRLSEEGKKRAEDFSTKIIVKQYEEVMNKLFRN
jgi:glycosyltransferase involved in cell wall biosynthesis